jgi:hypothetical protein
MAATVRRIHVIAFTGTMPEGWEGEEFFWNENDGWTIFECATHYTGGERAMMMDLPMDGKWDVVTITEEVVDEHIYRARG